MKAAIVTTPGVLAVQEIAEPQVGPYDAKCRLLFGATCTGTDQHLIHGRFPWPVRYPTILGHESIGRVIEVGEKVRHFQVGDLITRVGTPAPQDSELDANWGGFTEFGIAKDHRAMQQDGVPESEWSAYRVNQKLPADIDPAAATMMITWRETWSYLSRMGVGNGSRVLVLGSGGNGLAFAAHAKNLGASQITMIGQAAREEAARQIGVQEYFDYKSENLIEKIGESQPQGFDFTIDALGKAGQLSAALPLVAVGGLVAIYGIDELGEISLDIGRARGTFTFYVGGYDEAEAHNAVVEMLQNGKLNARHWLDLDHPFELENINAAFDAVRDRKLIKALVRLGE